MQIDTLLVVRIILLVIALALSIAATATPQINAGGADYYLAEAKFGGTSIKYKDLGCDSFRDRMGAALAFAILCILSVAAALICAGLLFANVIPNALRPASVGFSIFAWISALISWAIVVGTFHAKLCGAGASASQSGADLDAGVGLMIATWIILLIDVVVAIFGFTSHGSHSAPDRH